MTTLLNVAAYTVQLGVLVLAAIAVTGAVRLRAPGLVLRFWQLVFATGVVLPILQPRAAAVTPGGDGATVLASANAALAALPAPGVDPVTVLIYLLAAGIAIRLLWLAVGFIRLRAIVGHATGAEALHPVARELAAAIGADAALTLSDEVHVPATVGVRRPLILLPRRILDLPARVQRAVIAHELVHVKRRDWLHTLLEECWCAVLWFHPAARLLASRLSLAREMVVDETTILLTRDRRAYAEALLAFSTPQPSLESRLPGVTALISPRQLSQRIALIAEEAPMSRHRVLASFAAALFVSAGATASAVNVLPMTAVTVQSTQIYRPGDGVTLPVVVHEVKPAYTREAMQQKIQGSVFMLVVVLGTGDVGDVRVTESLDAEYGLDREAVKAAKQWKFKPGTKDGKAVAVEVTVQMTFTLK